MANPSSFTIKELTGEKRTLELRGRALPYQSFKLSGKQRAEFTWYPGNPTATVQMLGTEEGATTITGMWKDRFIKTLTPDGERISAPEGTAVFKGGQLQDALAVTLAVEQLRLSGQLLEVKWDQLVRHGILTRFDQDWKRREDVAWEMEFQWTSRGEAKQPVTLVVSPTVDDYAAKLRAAMDNITAATAQSFEVRTEFSTALGSLAAQIDAAVSQMEDAVITLASSTTTPGQSAQRALAATETVKTASAGLVSLVDAQPPRAVQNVSITAQTLGSSLVCDSYTRGIRNAARTMELLAAEQADTLRALTNIDDLLAAFTARSPGDLRDVATQFYGDQSEWRTLKRFNGFSSSKLLPGDLVLVPKITTSDSEA